MPELNMNFVATAGTVSATKTFNASIEQRYLDWLWYAYPQLEADGETPKPRTPANEAQAWRDWFNKTITGTWNNVKRWEQREAAQAASDAIADMP